MLYDHAGFTSPPFADAETLVAGVLAGALRPAAAVDLVAWTERSIIFGQDEPMPGRYSFEQFPFFRPIMEALSPEDPTRVVTFKKSAQIGGTVLADSFLLGWLDLAPAQLMCVHPTLPQAKKWVFGKVKPKVRNSPVLQQVISFDNPKDAKVTELLFERLDGRGSVMATGANSSASLSQHTIKAQVQDDLSKWENNDAGDPETQADSRSKAYEDAKILKVSTPLEEGSCKISRAFHRGTQEHWHVPCPHCQTLQPLEWAFMQRNIDAALDEGRPAQEGAFFTCQGCEAPIGEKHRAWMVDPANGATMVPHNLNPAPGERSFYIWAAYAPLESWGRIASAYATARGDQAKERTFLNDGVGLTYKIAGEAPDYHALMERGESNPIARRSHLAPGHYFLFAGVDVQENRVEVGLWAFGPNLRRQPVDHIIIAGSIAGAEGDDVMAQLDKLLLQSWPDFWGKPIQIRQLAIDVGYERQKVLDWVKRHPPSRVAPVVGARSDHAPAIGMAQTRQTAPNGKRIAAERIVYEVGGGALKAYLYGDLRKGDPLARGHVALGKGFSLDWYEQLTSEVRSEVENKRGHRQYQWVRLKGRRNEVLDCAVYAHWAAEMMGWKRTTDDAWAAIAQAMDGPADKAQAELFDESLPGEARALAQALTQPAPAFAAGGSAPAGPAPAAGGSSDRTQPAAGAGSIFERYRS
jgi:phage terminase large subunit GpA-like protein